MTTAFKNLAKTLDGEIHFDPLHRALYATDASMYREMPMAVVHPKNISDLLKTVAFAREQRISLIPRAAGTSLAGQVVGSGMVVEIAKHFTGLLEVNEKEKWCRVQPGIIRDDLNLLLKPHGLLFGPETSTANRATIGGMIGNNSCGLHSIIWGSARDQLISCQVILSDGSEAVFEELTPEAFHQKRSLKTLEGRIYQNIFEELTPTAAQEEIRREFPKPHIPRRNNGYAVDLLLRSNLFTPTGPNFNMCQLLAGSEGTLAIVTEAKLRLANVLPPVVACVALHFHDLVESLHANIVAVRHKPAASELIDEVTINMARENHTARQNSQWIVGAPKSIIVVEFAKNTREEVDAAANALIRDLKEKKLGYAYPVFYNDGSHDETKPIWALRKAVLGLMFSATSETKPVNVVEDCAVDVADLPEFYRRHEKIIRDKGVASSTSAHAGTGELHTIPFLNLKTTEGLRLLREILEETVILTKEFQGSLSGEHGDGRLRGEFIRKMIGDKNYELCRRIKKTWDPENLFNPNKVVDAPPVEKDLRYVPHTKNFIPTVFNWDAQGGVLRAAEQCNGMGECKKSGRTGGIMCPSYMATHDEKHTTRGRANILREYLTNSPKKNPFDHAEIKEVMDLCLSCKGCKSECPSSVDVAKLKAEFQQNYMDAHGAPLRSRMIAGFASSMTLASLAPGLFNFFAKNPLTAWLFKKVIGFANQRSIPTLHSETLKRWYVKNYRPISPEDSNYRGRIFLFCDEFTDLNDTTIGMAAIQLLHKLGYVLVLRNSAESGRAMLSKGFLRSAQKLAVKNVLAFKDLITEETPLVGIEPSAISVFKDEYPDLVPKELLPDAKKLSKNTLMFEEFICREIAKGKISPDSFTQESRLVKVHGHCHQKSLTDAGLVAKALSLPKNFKVETIPSSCCGMAGSFGYEKEHYDISMKIGELTLFPSIRNSPDHTIIAASGTSCRHQIHDGTGVRARHTAEILLESLVS